MFMNIYSKELIDSFIDENKFDLNREELYIILNSPWRFLSEEFESDEFNIIRFRYFGVFTPIKSRLNNGKNNNK